MIEIFQLEKPTYSWLRSRFPGAHSDKLIDLYVTEWSDKFRKNLASERGHHEKNYHFNCVHEEDSNKPSFIKVSGIFSCFDPSLCAIGATLYKRWTKDYCDGYLCSVVDKEKWGLLNPFERPPETIAVTTYYFEPIGFTLNSVVQPFYMKRVQ